MNDGATAQEELRAFLTGMSVQEFVKFGELLRFGKPTHLEGSPVSADIVEDPEDWKRCKIEGILAARHNNPPYYEMVCRATGIRADEARTLDYQRISAAASIESAQAARMSAKAAVASQKHAAEANRIAGRANVISVAALIVSIAAALIAGIIVWVK